MFDVCITWGKPNVSGASAYTPASAYSVISYYTVPLSSMQAKAANVWMDNLNFFLLLTDVITARNKPRCVDGVVMQLAVG